MIAGALEIYGVKKVVESVQDPVKEISLEDASANRSEPCSLNPNCDFRNRPKHWAALPPRPPSK